MGHPVRYSPLTLAALALFVLIGDASAQTRDSIVWVDSLVPSSTWIQHKPLRAGGSLGVIRSQLSETSTPMPVVLDPGCECFEGDVRYKPAIALHAEIPFWGDVSPWTFMAELGIRDLGGRATWDTTFPARSSDMQIVDASINSEITASLLTAYIKPKLTYQPTAGLRLGIGPMLGVKINSSARKEQRIVTPDLYFDPERRTRERQTYDGDLPESASLLVGLDVRAGYEFALSKKIYAEPYLGFSWTATPITPYWRHSALHAGISMHFDLTPREEIVPTFTTQRVQRVVQVPVPPVLPLITSSIEAVGIDREGNESPVINVSLEDVRSRNAYPVLNFMFFDEGSSELPARYVRYGSYAEASQEFKGSRERESVPLLELYRETLNILGHRLRETPSAKVRLIGSTSNTGIESANAALGRARAQRVADYLTNIWQIAPGRITIEGRALPPNPSPTSTSAGQQENRRVEIIVEEAKVTDPVTVYNIERLSTPDRLLLLPNIIADSGVVKSIRAGVRTGDRELAAFEGGPEGLRSTKPWAITEEDIKQFKDSLTLYLEVIDSAGIRHLTTGSIPVLVRSGLRDKTDRLERYSLILFDFDVAHVGKKNERVLRSVAKTLSDLKPERISIIGHTDETGNEAHNNALSLARAQETKKELERVMHDMKLPVPDRILLEGRGSRDRLHDNTLPEGRFFSRTVIILIERRPG